MGTAASASRFDETPSYQDGSNIISELGKSAGKDEALEALQRRRWARQNGGLRSYVPLGP